MPQVFWYARVGEVQRGLSGISPQSGIGAGFQQHLDNLGCAARQRRIDATEQLLRGCTAAEREALARACSILLPALGITRE